jgi:hypothetical protein
MANLNEAFDPINPGIASKKNSLKEEKKLKSAYGFECDVCKGCIAYHRSIQGRYHHEFIKGQYRKYLPHECGPFIDGMPLIN